MTDNVRQRWPLWMDTIKEIMTCVMVCQQIRICLLEFLFGQNTLNYCFLALLKLGSLQIQRPAVTSTQASEMRLMTWVIQSIVRRTLAHCGVLAAWRWIKASAAHRRKQRVALCRRRLDVLGWPGLMSTASVHLIQEDGRPHGWHVDKATISAISGYRSSVRIS